MEEMGKGQDSMMDRYGNVILKGDCISQASLGYTEGSGSKKKKVFSRSVFHIQDNNKRAGPCDDPAKVTRMYFYGNNLDNC